MRIGQLQCEMENYGHIAQTKAVSASAFIGWNHIVPRAFPSTRREDIPTLIILTILVSTFPITDGFFPLVSKRNYGNISSEFKGLYNLDHLCTAK